MYVRTDSALDPWLAQLAQSLRELYPPSTSKTSDFPQLWPARVTLTHTTREALEQTRDPLLDTPSYWDFTLDTNKRTTAPDWYQDVRHFEFSTDADLEYAIRPIVFVECSQFAYMNQEMLRSYIQKLLQMTSNLSYSLKV